MSRVYHYDTTYEQEAEDGTVTGSVELRIYYTVTWGREATRDEPGHGDTAEFHSMGIEILVGGNQEYRMPDKSMSDQLLAEWAEQFAADHQAELILDAEDILAGEREARRIIGRNSAGRIGDGIVPTRTGVSEERHANGDACNGGNNRQTSP
jgi:hypothetical protein